MFNNASICTCLSNGTPEEPHSVQSLWQRCGSENEHMQCCDSDGADSNVTALTVTALGQQW